MDLYRFFDDNDRLLYVGISLHAAARASGHRGNQTWWPMVVTMCVQHLATDDRLEAEGIERDVILAERPVFNVVHNLHAPIAYQLPLPRVVATRPRVRSRGEVAASVRREALRLGLWWALDDDWGLAGKKRKGFRCMGAHASADGRLQCCSRNSTMILWAESRPLALCDFHGTKSRGLLDAGMGPPGTILKMSGEAS